MSDLLVNDILEYMQDKEARYAIALEGEWGSGKTRFCEGELKEALYEKGYAMLRVSLLGVVADGLPPVARPRAGQDTRTKPSRRP